MIEYVPGNISNCHMHTEGLEWLLIAVTPRERNWGGGGGAQRGMVYQLETHSTNIYCKALFSTLQVPVHFILPQGAEEDQLHHLDLTDKEMEAERGPVTSSEISS